MSIEQEIQAKGLTAPRVTPADIEANIKHVEYVKHVSHSGQVLRWAVITTQNGFAVTGDPSASVSPENDRAEIGEAVALENAKSAMWTLMGYALKQKLHEAATYKQSTGQEDRRGLVKTVVVMGEDFALGKACDLSDDGGCESCQ